MRERVSRDRLIAFLDALGESAAAGTRAYLVGGASAVWVGWRTSTVDVDLKLEPDSDAVLSAIPRLKEKLDINVEFASPGDFLPEVPAWRDRSPFLGQHGQLAVFNYDFYAQALAKLERGHEIDRQDLAAMLAAGLIQRARVREYFTVIEPQLYRFPAVDPASFRRRVAAFCEEPA